LVENYTLSALVAEKPEDQILERVQTLKSPKCNVVRASWPCLRVLTMLGSSDLSLAFFDMESEESPCAELIDSLRSGERNTKLIVTSRMCRIAGHCEDIQSGACD
jgi:ActR/RegA family two-component response regulator